MIALDFGTGNALCVYGPDGIVDKRKLGLPRILEGAQEFPSILRTLLEIDDVVVESPTVGSSGAYIEDVMDVVESVPYTFNTISGRAVKNYCLDHGIERPPEGTKERDEHAAEILYRIATEYPSRVRTWAVTERISRRWRSVRSPVPMDKRDYKDERSVSLLATLPPFCRLPLYLQLSPVGLDKDYRKTIVIPFALAMEEPYFLEGTDRGRRDRFERLIGSHDRGHPSFYRRMYITWMHENVRIMFGSLFGKDDIEKRRLAFRRGQSQRRDLLRLSLLWQKGLYPSDEDLFPKDEPPKPRAIRGH